MVVSVNSGARVIHHKLLQGSQSRDLKKIEQQQQPHKHQQQQHQHQQHRQSEFPMKSVEETRSAADKRPGKYFILDLGTFINFWLSRCSIARGLILGSPRLVPQRLRLVSLFDSLKAPLY